MYTTPRSEGRQSVVQLELSPLLSCCTAGVLPITTRWSTAPVHLIHLRHDILVSYISISLGLHGWVMDVDSTHRTRLSSSTPSAVKQSHVEKMIFLSVDGWGTWCGFDQKVIGDARRDVPADPQRLSGSAAWPASPVNINKPRMRNLMRLNGLIYYRP